MGGGVGFEFARGIGGWVGLRNGWMGGMQKLKTVLGIFYTYTRGVYRFELIKYHNV
jgi:hypothetical protein